MSDDEFDVVGAAATAPAARAAMAWVQLVRDGDFSLVWSAMTEDFRLVCVQDWMVHNPAVMDEPSAAGLTRDELASQLAAAEPAHPMWARGAAHVAERSVRNMTTAVLGDREFGAGMRPRPVGLDLELIRIMPLDELKVDAQGLNVVAPGQVVESVSLLMLSLPGGWQVAGAAGCLPRPGWPPAMEPIVDPSD